MSSSPFKLASPYKPAGDQPKAIEALENGLKKGMNRQTLLGVTGSGKTFTMANVIASYGKPTLVIAHNKTLAAQLAQEYREFFPDNAVHYFVSYYDYYQPEAYIPSSDTYIEKEAMINEEIERLRHASTQALLTRKDTIIVASVSCIYGLGSPDEYEKVNMKLSVGMEISRAELLRKLIDIHFERTIADLKSGNFRAVGNTIEIMPVNDKTIFRIEYGNAPAASAGENPSPDSASRRTKGERVEPRGSGITISNITELDPVSRSVRGTHQNIFVFPAKHFISSDEQSTRALATIKAELEGRLKELDKAGKILEAERLKRRVRYDLAMIKEIGYTNGIENYSRHFSGKMPGEPPDSLLSYFPHKADGTPDFLTVVDESHVTIPQLNGMYAGDASRKENLVEHGFRLPSARDNRPLKFPEFLERIGPMIYTSATPGPYEKETSQQTVEQVIRPTGLIDPIVEIRPIKESNSGKSDFTFGNSKDYASSDDFVISVPAGIQTKKDLFDFYAKKAKFPDYFGANWDAFNDCLKDFSWITQKRIVIAHKDMPFSDDEKEAKAYLKIISEAISAPKISGHELVAVFPEKFKSELSEGYRGQIFDFIDQALETIAKGDRVIATTLTKKMAEDLSEFLKEKKVKAAYLHSDIKTIERINIITDFRRGKYDILVGVNLLREGLDMPEVSLIGILDADKEGFLRSETALIQTIGRAARNSNGRVILYADNVTGSMDRAMKETSRRRDIQLAYNEKHGITPTTIKKAIHDITDQLRSEHDKAVNELVKIDEELARTNPKQLMKQKEAQMEEAVKALDFETAALIRDELFALEEKFGKGVKKGNKRK